jgi:hypothetical protein
LILATYPKCGTTWVQNIMYLLLHDGEPLQADQGDRSEVFPHLEEAGAEVRRAICQCRGLSRRICRFRMTP